MEQEVKWYWEGIFGLFPASHGKFSTFYLELLYFAIGVLEKIILYHFKEIAFTVS